MKVVEAAQAQIAAIHRLDARGELEALPEKLKETARLRTENPESNLAELAECNKICRADNTSVIWKIKKPSGKSISEILKMAGQIAKEGIDRLYKEIKRN